jgi:hypothetical protein
VPLGGGRYGVCCVLGTAGELVVRRKLIHLLLVAALDVTTERVPNPTDIAMAGVLRGQRPGFQGPVMGIISDPRPKGFAHIGSSPEMATRLWQAVGAGDTESLARRYGFWAWDTLRIDIEMEWLWVHDRATHDATVEALRAAEDRFFAEERRRTAGTIASLADVRGRALFRGWNAELSPRILAACRALLVEAARRLRELNADASEDAKLETLRECVQGFNDLDDRNGHFIETTLAEQVSIYVGELARLAGIPEPESVVDRWRTW